MSKNPPPLPLITGVDYRSLIGEHGWNRLHRDIRQRFCLENAHRRVVYGGVMDRVYLSPAGKLLAQLCRLIGKPLVLHNADDVPMEVKVYPDAKLGGMTWDRYYNYRDRQPDRVRSTKCIRPYLGLIEVVGFGFGMHLEVYEQGGAIVFESKSFFWQLGNLRIGIPPLLTPGKTIVRQKALENRRFEFTLDVRHPLLGQVFYQVGEFAEQPDNFGSE